MPRHKLSLNTDSIGRKQVSFAKQAMGKVSAPKKRIRRK